ncbi:hypothetical protein AORI_2818 [Amycolatopsis keratiniphila]|uniref:Uncharacterized protein n=1 Tax=Amycolatopsis keratiniphila TaxID=129921 RepID=R4SS63_9PSEU|nr:hypothetical protein AORI_2818 [Amycolatopsis keratiniphila]
MTGFPLTVIRLSCVQQTTWSPPTPITRLTIRPSAGLESGNAETSMRTTAPRGISGREVQRYSTTAPGWIVGAIPPPGTLTIR